MPSTGPNFFLVGAPKAGTTSFARYLEQHPSIFMSPIKEPCFFMPEILDCGLALKEAYRRDRDALQEYLDQPVLARRGTGLVFRWDQYMKLFKGAEHETAIGEATVAYLGSQGAPRAIRARVPQARVMMILRDPADRLRSYWAAALVAGATALGFGDWLDEQIERERFLPPPLGRISTGFYAENVKRYFDTFPAEQIKPIVYDDYARDPQSTLRDVFAFLGVDSGWVSSTSRRHNVLSVPRWPSLHQLTLPLQRLVRATVPEPAFARMSELWRQPFRPSVSVRERAKAIAVYERDIHVLASFLRRDLSSWLDPQFVLHTPACISDREV
jgi:hypothetical protein